MSRKFQIATEKDTHTNEKSEKRTKKSKKYIDTDSKESVNRITEHRKSRRHKKVKHDTEVNCTSQSVPSISDCNPGVNVTETITSLETQPSVPQKKKKRTRDGSVSRRVKSHSKTVCNTDVLEQQINKNEEKSSLKRKKRTPISELKFDDQGDTRTVVGVEQLSILPQSIPHESTTLQSRSESHNSSKSSLSGYSRTPPNRIACNKPIRLENTSRMHNYARSRISGSPEHRSQHVRKPMSVYRRRSRSHRGSDDRGTTTQISKRHKHSRVHDVSRQNDLVASYSGLPSSNHSRARYHDYSPRRTFRQKYFRGDRSRSHSSTRHRHDRHPDEGNISSRKYSKRNTSRKPHGSTLLEVTKNDADSFSGSSVKKRSYRDAKERSSSLLNEEFRRGKSSSPATSCPSSDQRRHHKQPKSNISGACEQMADADHTRSLTTTSSQDNSYTNKCAGVRLSKAQSNTSSVATFSDECHSASSKPNSNRMCTIVQLLRDLKTESISDTELNDLLPASLFISLDRAPVLTTKRSPGHPSSESPGHFRNMDKQNKDHKQYLHPESHEKADDLSSTAVAHYRLATDALEKISQLRTKLVSPENWDSTNFSVLSNQTPTTNEQDAVVDDLLLPADHSLVAMISARTETSNDAQLLLASSLSTPWHELVESATKVLPMTYFADDSQQLSTNAALRVVNVAQCIPTPNRLLPIRSRAHGASGLLLAGVSRRYLGTELLECLQQELEHSSGAIPTPTVNLPASMGTDVDQRMLHATLSHASVLSTSCDRIIRLNLLGYCC